MHEPWEDNISEEKRWAKINIAKKRSSCIEKGCLEKYTTTAVQVKCSRTEYSS
jgi:hypothetical protein